MKFKGFTLDPFQEQSIKSVDKNNSVVVSAPTGSGKTLIADYIISKYVKKGVRVIYTAPIKALSNQKYKEFCTDFGKDNIGLLTGDIVINSGAPILIMTTEIYRNMAISNDPTVDNVSYVVFDEIHFINDYERGYVWEESIIFSKSHVRFLCLSATIPNAQEFANWIMEIKEHQVDVVMNKKRNVPLKRYFYTNTAGISDIEKVKQVMQTPRRKKKIKNPYHVHLVREIKDKLPCLFFNFSRRKCQESALELSKKKIFKYNPEIKKIVRHKLSLVAPEIKRLKSTKLLRKTLAYGVAFHHAGLLPVIKELVEDLFSRGLINVLYTTETFAVGVNMPAKTVCFESLRKFDGRSFRLLNSKEYFQIAGRAGRRGIDKVGYTIVMVDRRDFNYHKYKKITDKDMDPIKSQFRLGVNTVLNLIDQHAKPEIDIILGMNFHNYQEYGKDFKKRKGVAYLRFHNITKKLKRLGYVKDDKLTKKGKFASQIYSEEILTGEIFATDFYKPFNEYQLLLILASIVYEPRKRTKLYKKYKSKELSELQLACNELDKKKFRSLYQITALIRPCYLGKSLFDILDNTNLLEGDVIRFFRQILDRIGQILNATSDQELIDKMYNCQHMVHKCVEEVDAL
ncbi:MAG: ATP-dependent DNA helicase [Candidatus Woesearchaeota archaeon]|nr:ATP-dependent DNA helicase [Candidatus Woesearchaeota archaeon]